MTIIIITRIINNSIELALKAVFNKDLLKGYATKCKVEKISKYQDLKDESNGSAGVDHSPGSNTLKSHKTSENHGAS